MKAFQFPLERALHWRRAQLGLEELHARNIAGSIGRLDERRADLQQERFSAEHAILQSQTVEARELAPLAAFQLRVRKEEVAMREQRLGLERDLAAQRQKLVEAQRKVKLIENLRRKRLAHWSSELSREQEQFAAEAFLGRWQAGARYTRAERAGAGTIEGTGTDFGSRPALASTTYTTNPAIKL